MKQPTLRPQDVVVLLKLIACKGQRPSITRLAADLSLSPSEVHGALKRLVLSRLVSTNIPRDRPLVPAVEEFLVHAVKYAFPAQRGEATRGVPTSSAAPPLVGHLVPGSDPPPVWPHPEGNTRGNAFAPLYPKVPLAASRDSTLYELLALVDALREGRARERHLAEQALTSLIRALLHG